MQLFYTLISKMHSNEPVKLKKRIVYEMILLESYYYICLKIYMKLFYAVIKGI